MSLLGYCCPDTLGIKGTICGNAKRKGGIKHAAWLKIGQTTIIDYTSEAQWLLAIANGDANILYEIRGEFPEASEVESDRLIGCGSDTELDGFDQQFNWLDRAVNQINNDYYSRMNECPGHFVIFDCQPGGTARIHVIDNVDVTFVCKPTIIEASLNTTQRYPCTAKWSSILPPDIYDAPLNIFP